MTSAVNMTLNGHTENSQALEIEPPPPPPPAEKASFYNNPEIAL